MFQDRLLHNVSVIGFHFMGAYVGMGAGLGCTHVRAQGPDSEIAETTGVHAAHVVPDAGWRVPSTSAAMQRVRALTGFDEQVGFSTPRLIELNTDKTPFLAAGLVNRPLWRIVTTAEWDLTETLPGSEDAYHRAWEILIDPLSGALVKIVSPWPPGESRIPDEPSAVECEAQFTSHGNERYHGWCPADGTISFADALRTLGSEGVNPMRAKQIKAQCVMWSCMERDPRPAWVITYRGIPPFEASYPGVPIDARNHMRHILDAITGKWIQSNTLPQPTRATTPDGRD